MMLTQEQERRLEQHEPGPIPSRYFTAMVQHLLSNRYDAVYLRPNPGDSYDVYGERCGFASVHQPGLEAAVTMHLSRTAGRPVNVRVYNPGDPDTPWFASDIDKDLGIDGYATVNNTLVPIQFKTHLGGWGTATLEAYDGKGGKREGDAFKFPLGTWIAEGYFWKGILVPWLWFIWDWTSSWSLDRGKWMHARTKEHKRGEVGSLFKGLLTQNLRGTRVLATNDPFIKRPETFYPELAEFPEVPGKDWRHAMKVRETVSHSYDLRQKLHASDGTLEGNAAALREVGWNWDLIPDLPTKFKNGLSQARDEDAVKFLLHEDVYKIDILTSVDYLRCLSWLCHWA